MKEHNTAHAHVAAAATHALARLELSQSHYLLLLLLLGYLWLFPLLLLHFRFRLCLLEHVVVVLDLAQVRVLSKLHELPEAYPTVFAGQFHGLLLKIRI